MTYEEMYEKVKEFLNTLPITYQENYQIPNTTLTYSFYIEHNNNKVGVDILDFENNNSTKVTIGFPKPKKYFLNKSKDSTTNGIRYICGWQHVIDETINCKFGSWAVFQNIIKSSLGIYDKQIYARKTKVVEFPAKDTRAFFDANNINGYRNATITYALVDKSIDNPTVNDILMGYSVGHCYFGKGAYEAEIARGACVLGTQVIGGASKLWSYIIEKTSYKSIIYFTDKNYYDSRSISFLKDVQDVSHDVSFWNWHIPEQQLKNREPSKHSEIMAKRDRGELLEIMNAGTAAHLWTRTNG